MTNQKAPLEAHRLQSWEDVTKIFADVADIDIIEKMSNERKVSGFTTNPTIMKKAGIVDYKEFAKLALQKTEMPISFEVFSDDFDEMEKQAREISSWGSNVYVKIPITNTKGESSAALVKRLLDNGIKVNITAILTYEQVKVIKKSLSDKTPSIISIFAGRIADTGINPMPIMKKAVRLLGKKNTEVLWASSREVYNIIEAQKCGCHIITLTNDLVNKMNILGKDLNQLSLDTVKMFYDDAKLAGYKIL